jgi:hypothetical protein
MDIQILATLGAMILAAMTLWHTIVLNPISKEIAYVRETGKANSEAIHHLEITNARLSTTLDGLTEAINRLTERMERG